MPRGKPFSGKKKAEQLKAKRAAKRGGGGGGGGGDHDASDDAHAGGGGGSAPAGSRIPAGALADSLGISGTHNKWSTKFAREEDEAVQRRRYAAARSLDTSRRGTPFVARPQALLDPALAHPRGVVLAGAAAGQPHLAAYLADAREAEEAAFTEWLGRIYDIYSRDQLNHFEHSLEVWMQLWHTVATADVVCLVTDVRNPLWHVPPSLYEQLTAAGAAASAARKPLVLLLNKCDLVPQAQVDAWVAYLRAAFPAVAAVVPFSASAAVIPPGANLAARRRAIRDARIAFDADHVDRRVACVRGLLEAAGAPAQDVDAVADRVRATTKARKPARDERVGADGGGGGIGAPHKPTGGGRGRKAKQARAAAAVAAAAAAAAEAAEDEDEEGEDDDGTGASQDDGGEEDDGVLAIEHDDSDDSGSDDESDEDGDGGSGTAEDDDTAGTCGDDGAAAADGTADEDGSSDDSDGAAPPPHAPVGRGGGRRQVSFAALALDDASDSEDDGGGKAAATAADGGYDSGGDGRRKQVLTEKAVRRRERKAKKAQRGSKGQPPARGSAGPAAEADGDSDDDGGAPNTSTAPCASTSGRALLTIGLVGHPNVGKSSVINTLCGEKRVSVSRTAGHTKRAQTIPLVPGRLALLDCPGLVFPHALVPPPAHVLAARGVSPAAAAAAYGDADEERGMQELCGVVPLAQVREPYTGVRLLAERLPLERLYGLALPRDEADEGWTPLLLCEQLAVKRGYHIARTGRPDSHAAGREVLYDTQDGIVPVSWLPPPLPAAAPAAAAVTAATMT